MINSGLEFDPIDFYNKDLKNRVKDASTKLFEDLTSTSKVPFLFFSSLFK